MVTEIGVASWESLVVEFLARQPDLWRELLLMNDDLCLKACEGCLLICQKGVKGLISAVFDDDLAVIVLNLHCQRPRELMDGCL